MQRRARTGCRVLVGAIASGGLLFGAGLAGSAPNVVVTAAQGETSLEDSSQAPGTGAQDLTTGTDGGCSALLDRNAVVELCNDTRVSFRRHDRRGNRIVTIESGSVRLLVEPRAAEERIEVHTPAAIATILGTVVTITVDPATGETTITSSESDINIRDRSEEDCTPRGLPPEAGVPECSEGTTIGPLEQFRASPGGPSRTEKLTQEQVDEIGGCLLNFHEVAVAVDRMAQEEKAAERVAAIDAAAIENLQLGGGGGEPPGDSGDGDGVEVELDPTETGNSVDDLLGPPMMIDCSGGIPGEHCAF